ncbi:site-specific integrase [Catenulispora sp. NL8]|uniref:Site-specific integrase n=1 Tax=Catenulispora pinistramenti TaxID=2705254 RepID=A0ABS5KLP6_9ACTN|nr:site-specific integrase [Catenulispora pinistramenti]MBS2546959.1 site-specific integrase [Catenulispora pinistramenti]
MNAEATFKVRIWEIREFKGARGKSTYECRWFLGDETKPRREQFKSKRAASSHQSMLIAAQRSGEAFAFITGLPVSHLTTIAALTPPAVEMRTALDLATAFVDRKWKDAAATYRVDIAKTMTAFTVAMLDDVLPARFNGQQLRSALRIWQFAVNHRAGMPDDMAEIVSWIAGHTRLVNVLDDADIFETVFSKVTSKLDGTPMAESSYKRYRTILKSFLNYCVRLQQLRKNPLDNMEITDTKANRATTAIVPIDRRRLADNALAESLLAAVVRTSRNGEAQSLAMEVMYRAGLRPEEVVALLAENFVPPKQRGGWGSLVFEESSPETDKRWTDDGTRRERRQLKHRGKKTTRTVPAHPVLAAKLVAYIEGRKLKGKARLFSGQRGGELNYRVFDKSLKRAREAVMSAEQIDSVLARTLYDWRHLCLTNWLNRGVPPANVAMWAGNSVPVLLAIYVNVVDNEELLLRRLEGMYDDTPPAAG